MRLAWGPRLRANAWGTRMRVAYRSGMRAGMHRELMRERIARAGGPRAGMRMRSPLGWRPGVRAGMGMRLRMRPGFYRL
jgi:hypothetical protein